MRTRPRIRLALLVAIAPAACADERRPSTASEPQAKPAVAAPVARAAPEPRSTTAGTPQAEPGAESKPGATGTTASAGNAGGAGGTTAAKTTRQVKGTVQSVDAERRTLVFGEPWRGPDGKPTVKETAVRWDDATRFAWEHDRKAAAGPGDLTAGLRVTLQIGEVAEGQWLATHVWMRRAASKPAR
jgi:hypothetical protein